MTDTKWNDPASTLAKFALSVMVVEAPALSRPFGPQTKGALLSVAFGHGYQKWLAFQARPGWKHGQIQ